VPVSLLTPGTVCFYVGAGEDITFDLALARDLGCEVHTFAPTPKAIRYVDSLRSDLPGNLMFHPWGVWARDERMRFYAPKDPRHVSHSIVNLQHTTQYFDAECKRLRTILDDLGHLALRLLKMDLEGAEYRVIESMIGDGIRPTIVAVEFDEIHTPLDAEADCRIAGAIKSLVGVNYQLAVVNGPNYTFVDGASI
jgi:FkbM family methyltransferase